MADNASTVKVPVIPVVVKKGSTLLWKKNLPHNDLFMRCLKLNAMTKDQLIYKSVPGDFLRGEFPGLTLVSRLNVFNKTSSTIAKFSANDGSDRIIEKNSQEVIKVIGQKNYDTVFSALCSVISQELRIRALLALLTIEGNINKKEVSAQTEKSYAESACQTDDTSKNILQNFKQRRRIRRQQFRPYIVKEDDRKLKRIVIDPKSLLSSDPTISQNSGYIHKDNETLTGTCTILKCVPKTEMEVAENYSFPELNEIINEDSNFSDTSAGNISLSSQLSLNLPSLLENPYSVLGNVDNHTKAPNIVPLTLLDGSVIMVCTKPIDKFHWATPNILRNLSQIDQSKLMYQQAFIHWKYCLERDDDGYLPIHHAVLSSDIDFLYRQCAALNKKYGSVDVPASGNMTALQMSIYKGGERCTAVLLRNGADPRLQDDEGKSFFHTAAEVSQEHLKIALEYCRTNARAIMKDDDELWNPVMENQPDEQLAKILLDHICIMCDNQGYTPLMLASKQGNDASVRLLLDASPETVNRPMPNCGSSALYLAVEAACVEVAKSNNQTKISENFMKTIEILMENGGDPSMENHFGSSVNLLLTEFSVVDLSVLIANKLTSVKYFDGKTFDVNNINSLMLLRNSNGKVDVKEIRSLKNDDDSKHANITGTNGATGTAGTADGNAKGMRAVNSINNDSVELNKNQCSKVQIKDIKNIKINKRVGHVGVTPKLDKQCTVPAPVNVKPSRVIIFPKAKSKSDVPKYVRILPKLNKRTVTGHVKIDSTECAHEMQNVNATDNTMKNKSAQKRKNNTECEVVVVKKQCKETRSLLKKKLYVSLDSSVLEESNLDIKTKEGSKRSAR